MILKNFFGSKTLYFVCGKVYKDNSYANRIVHWFVQHGLPVVPITPNLGTVDLKADYITAKRQPHLPSLKVLPSISAALEALNKNDSKLKEKRAFDSISVNFVTPANITLQILKEIKSCGAKVQACWFQPGSYDYACIKYAEEELQLGKENVISDCVLVKGFANMCPSDISPFTL
ncbi:hypothetical protein ACO0QE_003064 [Hanseniaspora vineae]